LPGLKNYVIQVKFISFDLKSMLHFEPFGICTFVKPHGIKEHVYPSADPLAAAVC